MGKGREGKEGKRKEGRGKEGGERKEGKGREGKGRDRKGRKGSVGLGREGGKGKEGMGRENGERREGKGQLVDLISKHQSTETKAGSNPSTDPNRYRRRCPDPNARIQKIFETHQNCRI